MDEVAFTNPDFVPEMVSYVRSKGKKVISWNPGWHYKPGEIDMTHLWSYRGKAQPGIPAIDSKFHYLNHFDTFADLVALYNSRIYNKVEGSDDIAGTILAIWNDRMISKRRRYDCSKTDFIPVCLPLQNVHGEVAEQNISMGMERCFLPKIQRYSMNLLILKIVCYGIKNIHSKDILCLCETD